MDWTSQPLLFSSLPTAPNFLNAIHSLSDESKSSTIITPNVVQNKNTTKGTSLDSVIVINDADTLKSISESDPNAWGICPYSTRHRMPLKSLLAHVRTCPDKPPTPDPLVTCPFNKDHRMPESALAKHIRKCADNKIAPSLPAPVPKGDIFVFDLETDCLTTDFPLLSREEYMQRANMTVGVGWFANTFYTFTATPSDLRRLQDLMDKAATIVTQNHTFTFGILEKYLPTQSWHKKVFDFYDLTRCLFGSSYPLETLAEFNKEVPAKIGSASIGIELWKQGQLQDLVELCKRDVEVLLGLYNKRKRLRVPVRKDAITRKIVGVVTINLMTGVVPCGKSKRNKRVFTLESCASLPVKCQICVSCNKHKYPTKVVFEEEEQSSIS